MVRDFPITGEMVTPDIKDETANVATNPYMEPKILIRKGDRGEGVKWVQWWLWRFGLFTDENGQPDASQIDGIFGKKTDIAVREAQRRLELASDGIVGSLTRAAWKGTC